MKLPNASGRFRVIRNSLPGESGHVIDCYRELDGFGQTGMSDLPEKGTMSGFAFRPFGAPLGTLPTVLRRLRLLAIASKAILLLQCEVEGFQGFRFADKYENITLADNCVRWGIDFHLTLEVLNRQYSDIVFGAQFRFH